MAGLDRSYKILGVSPGAGEAEMKQAYRDLVKVWHPDRFPGDARLQAKAQDRLKEINEAYRRILSSPHESPEEDEDSGVQGAKPCAAAPIRSSRRSFKAAAVVFIFLLGCGAVFLPLVKGDIAEVPYNVGWSYFQSGHYDEALLAFRVACRINPESAKSFLALGRVYGQLGRRGEEWSAYRKAIEIDPSMAAKLLSLAKPKR